MLKTEYQDFIAPEGKRRFIQELNEDTTVTMTDVTEYEQQGDYMNATALNTTNETVNDLGVATSTLVGRTGDLEDEVAALGRQLAEAGWEVHKVSLATCNVGGQSTSDNISVSIEELMKGPLVFKFNNGCEYSAHLRQDQSGKWYISVPSFPNLNAPFTQYIEYVKGPDGTPLLDEDGKATPLLDDEGNYIPWKPILLEILQWRTVKDEG